MLPETILKFFAKFIENEIGIIYAEHNYYQLQSRLEEVSRLQGLLNSQQLYEQAQSGFSVKLRQQLLDISTNNETSFFRDIKIFNAIENLILNKLREMYPNKKLKIWSAASSTGQEAVSIAILLSENSNKVGTVLDYAITATDISDRVLAKASSGLYTQLDVQRGLPARLLVKYFEKINQDTWRPVQGILNKIQYSKLNLKQKYPFSDSFHLILCRNVLIYQNIESKVDIIKRVSDFLVEGGYLILGSGESLLGISSDFDQVAEQGVVVYRKKQNLKATA